MTKTANDGAAGSLQCTNILSPPPLPLSKKPISNVDAKLKSLLSASSPTKSSYMSPSPAWKCDWSHDGSILATCHGSPDPCIRLWKRRRSLDSSNTKSDTRKRNRSTVATEKHKKDDINMSDDEEEDEEWYLHAKLQVESNHDDSINTDNKTPPIQHTIRSISFAPTPKHIRNILAAASFDGSVYIWEDFSSFSSSSNPSLQDDEEEECDESTIDADAAGWEQTAQLEGHDNEVKDVAWNKSGTLLASCGRDKTVWVWEAFLPGAIGTDGGNNGDFECECLAVLEGHTQDVKCVEFAPSHDQWGDGEEILLSASYDDTIRCWAEDAGEWYCAVTLSTSVHSSTIWSIALCPGGVRMVSGSADESLAIWRCYTASEKKRDSFLSPLSLLEGGDENEEEEEFCNGNDGLWKCVGKIPSAHKAVVYSVDAAPSIAGHGRIASCGGDNCINIYREVGDISSSSTSMVCLNGGATRFVLDTFAQEAHAGDVNCIRWHPSEGTKLATVGDDGLVKIWRYNQSQKEKMPP